MGLGCDNLLVGKGLREPSGRWKELSEKIPDWRLKRVISFHSLLGRAWRTCCLVLAKWKGKILTKLSRNDLSEQKRMEGEFRRGVVHGRATYYLDNGTRYYQRILEKWMKPFFSRFVGLFRKGVPHGRAVVIGEDGNQVMNMKLFLLIFLFFLLVLFYSFRYWGSLFCWFSCY